MKLFAEGKECNSSQDSSKLHDRDDKAYRRKRQTLDDFDLYAIPKMLKGLDTSKFGSVAKDIEALCARRSQILKHDPLMNSKSLNRLCEQSNSKNWRANQIAQARAISLQDGRPSDDTSAVTPPVIYLSSDDEHSGDTRHSHPFLKQAVPKETACKVSVEVLTVEDDLQSKAQQGEEVNGGQSNVGINNGTDLATGDDQVILENNIQDFSGKEGYNDIKAEDDRMADSEDKSPTESVVLNRNLQAFSGKENYIETEDTRMTDKESKSPMRNLVLENSLQTYSRKKRCHEIETEDQRMAYMEGSSLMENLAQPELKTDNQNLGYGNTCAENDIADKDDLANLWSEMAVALGCSKEFSFKDINGDPSTVERAEDEGCDHSLVLKDDIGYVCRICGIIKTGIESVFEFSYNKGKRTSRTYASETRNTSDRGSTKILPIRVKSSIEELTVTEVAAHPRHMRQMKPHQLEGFNFLCSNLIADNPGGCILAHAPGSGKTFIIISFMQSFLARSPNVRPLVVLPKGILATWRKEFQIWQVEDTPLYDFYTFKADNRAQQLGVLRKWVEQKSIMFLGYQQFSTIICDNGTDKAAVECREILLKIPTILILDEGHTPRNEDTNTLQSLARVETPLKVVLSGTLYQNHVKEVFNILNLVRPKFMKLQTSRDAVRRIMCKVEIQGTKKLSSESTFFDLVEQTLQQKDDFKRKAAVIQDLRGMTSKVLHYYKGDFLEELPGLVDFTLILNLSKKQKREVENLKSDSVSIFKRICLGSLLYVHPCLKAFSKKNPSNGDKGCSIDGEEMDIMVKKLIVEEGVKTKFFLEILSLCESASEKLLVFSQYILPLKLFERLAIKSRGWSRDKEIFMITGDSRNEQREWSMERFNNSPYAKVFFGSIKACGEGISLVGASRIIILDVHLNPSVTRQAIGRAFRPGQKRKVYTYRLIAADSPEEEDHSTCFRKELISRMWFEWNDKSMNQEFDMKAVHVDECGDPFLESMSLREDLKVIYKRLDFSS
ncbi:hypothetical protein L6164_031877 [Bauhinia variegata]|uniref:Uncharacterized protein n=1 Tax=Bauhinia variegata TaxID=167791 RepID=A0ACB9KLX7_BAUVA|nr:hypothetical protein L6164_031877 [Bauhinia variegata]